VAAVAAAEGDTAGVAAVAAGVAVGVALGVCSWGRGWPHEPQAAASRNFHFNAACRARHVALDGSDQRSACVSKSDVSTDASTHAAQWDGDHGCIRAIDNRGFTSVGTALPPAWAHAESKIEVKPPSVADIIMTDFTQSPALGTMQSAGVVALVAARVHKSAAVASRAPPPQGAWGSGGENGCKDLHVDGRRKEQMWDKLIIQTREMLRA
jgi:hypothetical protein